MKPDQHNCFIVCSNISPKVSRQPLAYKTNIFSSSSAVTRGDILGFGKGSDHFNVIHDSGIYIRNSVRTLLVAHGMPRCRLEMTYAGADVFTHHLICSGWRIGQTKVLF